MDAEQKEDAARKNTTDERADEDRAIEYIRKLHAEKGVAGLNAPINQSPQGHQYLFTFCHRQPEVIKELLRLGADPHVKDTHKTYSKKGDMVLHRSALSYCMRYGEWKSAELLIRAGACSEFRAKELLMIIRNPNNPSFLRWNNSRSVAPNSLLLAVLARERPLSLDWTEFSHLRQEVVKLVQIKLILCMPINQPRHHEEDWLNLDLIKQVFRYL